eukprot:1597330-Alexandrium_andersonii.AAC.1
MTYNNLHRSGHPDRHSGIFFDFWRLAEARCRVDHAKAGSGAGGLSPSGGEFKEKGEREREKERERERELSLIHI